MKNHMFMPGLIALTSLLLLATTASAENRRYSLGDLSDSSRRGSRGVAADFSALVPNYEPRWNLPAYSSVPYRKGGYCWSNNQDKWVPCWRQRENNILKHRNKHPECWDYSNKMPEECKEIPLKSSESFD